jgi:hypothetical protein
MDKATRIELVNHAVRWANNILTEVASNHGLLLGPKAKLELKSAIKHLGEVMLYIATGE